MAEVPRPQQTPAMAKVEFLPRYQPAHKPFNAWSPWGAASPRYEWQPLQGDLFPVQYADPVVLARAVGLDWSLDIQ